MPYLTHLMLIYLPESQELYEGKMLCRVIGCSGSVREVEMKKPANFIRRSKQPAFGILRLHATGRGEFKSEEFTWG